MYVCVNVQTDMTAIIPMRASPGIHTNVYVCVCKR